MSPPSPEERYELRTRRERLRYWGWTAFLFLWAAAMLALAVDGAQQGGQDRTFALLGTLPFAVVTATAGLAFVRGWVDRPLVLVVVLVGLSLSSLAMIVAPEIPARTSKFESPAAARTVGALCLALVGGVGLFQAWRAWRNRKP